MSFLRYELELSTRSTVEADVFRLRGIRDSLTLTLCGLEMNVESLKEELVSLSNNHKKVRTPESRLLSLNTDVWVQMFTSAAFVLLQELEELRVQGTGSVNVEVDSVESADLMQVLEEVRQQYQTLMTNNKLELEKWFQSKVNRKFFLSRDG